ncbi:MAG TPA: hypothetical protein VFI61_01940, partial [Patescibacteria group bacterium]|nr:hypothetical protein [Patescibacteria group bacterium]
MIQAIIFDWGGVLTDNPADGLIEYCSTSLKITHDVLKTAFSKIEADFQKDLISEADLWKRI